MTEIKRKIVIITTIFLIAAMLLIPFAVAKPGAEKNNEKFEYFELVCSGATSETYDKIWITPPEADTAKTTHLRGGGWITGEVVELTVGDKTFTMVTDPYSVSWTTTFDGNLVYNNDGTNKLSILHLTDVLTVYNDGEEIGTLVLNLKSAIDFSTTPPGYSGVMQGYGTGALKDVHVSGIDNGLIDPVNGIFMRTGTITGWPEEVTNIIS